MTNKAALELDLNDLLLNDMHNADARECVHLVLLKVATNYDVVQEVVIATNDKYLLFWQILDWYFKGWGGALLVVQVIDSLEQYEQKSEREPDRQEQPLD